jgi:6-phosphogluconolactonase
VKSSSPASPVTVFERALDFVKPGQWLGLGSGKASSAFVKALGARVRAGLQVVGLPTSVETETLARAEGIPLVSLQEAVDHGLDLHIDGADEFSPRLELIKGNGRCDLRERVVASLAREHIYLVGSGKRVQNLGERGNLPVDVVPHALPLVIRDLKRLGLRPVLWHKDGKPGFTDDGNHILDCGLEPQPDPAELDRRIRAIPGVVSTGFFLGLAELVLEGDADFRLVAEHRLAGRQGPTEYREANMAPNRVKIVQDADAMARAAAQRVVDLAGQAIAARGRFSIALSGGSTPKKLFELLARPEWATRIDWGKVLVFFGDERSVGPDDTNSNYRMARLALLDHVPVKKDHVFRMRGEQDLIAEAVRYQKDMELFLPHQPGGFPSLDLVLLGLGTDAHTASLFPRTRALHETRAWVAANDVPQLSTRRITLTYPVINHAREVLFLVAGQDKVKPLDQVLSGQENIEEYPAQGVKPHTGTHWMVDSAAAGGLPMAMRGGMV